MILSEKVIIKVSSSNYDYYKNIVDGIKLRESYEINVIQLNPTTHQKIEVKCDVCMSISFKPYREYIRSFNNKGMYCCSPKCAQSKNKASNLEKYGCENVFQSKSIKDKIKETNLLKYGVDYPTQSEYIRNKIKEVNLDRYGVDNPGKSEYFKSKMKNTCLTKFGSQNYTSSEEAKNKRIENGTQIPDELKTDFQIYLKKVRNKTKSVKKKLFENWNGLDYYDNEFIAVYLNLKFFDKNYPTIDHKISIYYGFLNNINPDIIGDLENLCITKRSINSSKNIKCS